MQQKPSGKSADGSPKLSPEMEEGLANLERVLQARDQGGQPAVDRELAKLFPGTKAKAQRIPLGPQFPDSSAGLQDGSKIPTVPYLGKKKPKP